MSEEESDSSKRSYEICPRCHQHTLLVHIVRRANPEPPHRIEQWNEGDCQNCGYSRPPKRLEWDSVSD